MRLQENQISSLCLNRTLKCLDLVLKNLGFTEFVWFGVQEEQSTQYWMHHLFILFQGHFSQ